MYRKRATLLTITSLKVLSKVRTPRVCSFDSIKASGLLRTLSIAAERSDFPIPSVSNGEGSVEYQRSPDGFYGDNQSHVGFQENPRIEFQHNAVGQNGNFSSGYYGEGNVNGFQGNPAEQNGGLQHSSTGQNEIIRGNCGENSAELWQGSGGYNMESFRTSEKSSDGWYGEQRNSHNPHGSYNDAGSQIQQNLNGFSQQSRSGFPGNTWHHGGSVGQFQQSASDRYSGKTSGVRQELNNYYVGNTTPTQHSPDNYHRSKEGNYWQNTNVNDQYLGNTGVSLQSINNSSIGETAMTQQSLGNYFSGSTTAHQPGMDTPNAGNGGVYPQGTYGYRGGTDGYSNGYVLNNTGERAWNPRESFNADGGLSYQRSSNESQSAMVDSQVSNSFKADGESVEAAGNGPCSRTTEELDDLCKEGKLKEVVELLGLLESKHVSVDFPRYLMLLKACGEAKALEEAKYVHEHLLRSIPAPKVSTYNKILEMYGKCGSMDDALMVFQKMPQRNLTSWDTMITWYANNGLGEDAIDLFTEFKKAGLKPDGKMFIGVFHACSVLGDMIEGMLHFESMSKDHGIAPSMKHYASVVDMMGTAGYLDEALEFIEKLPVEPSVDVWETLMNLSRVHGHAELGDRCAELVDLMDSSRLNEQSKAGLIPVKASDLAKVKEAKKLGPESLLSVRSKVHEYRAGDTSHPENDRIYALLRCLRGQMKEAGYVAETRFVLHDIDQESKEDALLAHSERLAVAYGLMNSPVRAQVRIIKNLRVCGDCHSALKIISKLVGREFIIRDAKRFHHFKDGLCSCRDYW